MGYKDKNKKFKMHPVSRWMESYLHDVHNVCIGRVIRIQMGLFWVEGDQQYQIQLQELFMT